jgi:hypothetical protein
LRKQLLLGQEKSMLNEFIECYYGIEEFINEEDEFEILLLINSIQGNKKRG